MSSSMNDDHKDDTSPFFGKKLHNDFNNKIMLTAAVSVALVIVIIVALHLYIRFVLRRQGGRRSIIGQLGLTVAQSRSSEPPKSGLDPTVIEALPTFLFKKQNNNSQDDMIECAVCLSVLENEEMVRELPNCKHIFHVDCIDKWLESQSTCPICRTEAEPRLELEPREGPTGVVPVLGDVPPPTAPPLEGTSSAKINGSNSNSRLSSFQRILSRERSSRRIQPSNHEDVIEDVERQ
ncbi:RING-H2 finger protein [Quillaja saponaria]|uniref:RING-type E3 ubiquitin transferase n=1 Tax=Quillaja saponaria TaxID=32244 RepID=A0AAD7KYS9_QUISA|nr:RING-H2 finger protein [Quillaja saponaria]KAJ7948399.1 RING-H2 finger protein [Quillaja saponaria]